MNIVLCGMMGSGKSTIGRVIAKNINSTFCDTDEVIEKKHGKISDIFAHHGESYFRELESETVKEISLLDGLVIATGGGLVLRSENVTLLKEKGKIVFLRARLETLEKRLQADTTRPLLQAEDGLRSRLDNLLTARTPIYERVADYTVDVDEKSAEEIALAIIALME